MKVYQQFETVEQENAFRRSRPRGRKTLVMPILQTEHEIPIAHKRYNYENKIFLALNKRLDIVFNLLINVKKPTIGDILTIMYNNGLQFNIYEQDKFHA